MGKAAALVALVLFAAGAAASAQAAGKTIALPGVSYEVLASGPADGAHPKRSDAVAMKYVGRLSDGAIFSTSTDNGRAPSEFKVREVIPGMSAALQLMRIGDRWRITLPGYLAYGALGRRYTPPEATLKRDIPPDATLVFDVELTAISPSAS